MIIDRVLSYMPLVAMVAVQVGLAGMNIISKVAMEAGMSPFVLVVYRQVVAAIVTAPYAIFLERNRPPLNKELLMQIFQCSILGATNQLMYFVGLKLTTVTISCAMANVVPAFTFIVAVLFKREVLGLKSRAGQAKIAGTAVCIGGALLMSFYHGPVFPIGQSKIHSNAIGDDTSSPYHGMKSFIGPLLVLFSNACWAVWFIVQAKLSESFDAPYTTTSLMCFMSTIQCIIPAVIADARRPREWALLDQPLRLIASFYSGMVGSALALCLIAWTIKRKGPVYVAAFSPLLLVSVAFLSWALIREKIYTGTVVGSIIIVMGLYVVLWGKNKQANEDLGNEAHLSGSQQDHSMSFEEMVVQRVRELRCVGRREPAEEEDHHDDIEVAMQMQTSTSRHGYTSI